MAGYSIAGLMWLSTSEMAVQRPSGRRTFAQPGMPSAVAVLSQSASAGLFSTGSRRRDDDAQHATAWSAISITPCTGWEGSGWRADAGVERMRLVMKDDAFETVAPQFDSCPFATRRLYRSATDL